MAAHAIGDHHLKKLLQPKPHNGILQAGHRTLRAKLRRIGQPEHIGGHPWIEFNAPGDGRRIRRRIIQQADDLRDKGGHRRKAFDLPQNQGARFFLFRPAAGLARGIDWIRAHSSFSIPPDLTTNRPVAISNRIVRDTFPPTSSALINMLFFQRILRKIV